MTAVDNVLDSWRQRIAATGKTIKIVLADAGDDRARQAAERLNADGVIRAVMMDTNPARFVTESMAGLASQGAKPVDLDDPLAVSVLMVAAGEADGCVAGASRTTADVIRAGLRGLGTARGVDTVSSCFFFVLPDGRPIAYGDCGVLPDPDQHQLALVAISTAATFAQLAQLDPKVAMLSFSTKGSAEHPRVDKVREATKLIRDLNPQLSVDGELQFDAAFVSSVGEAKAPGSPVAGHANVFVFPDLDSGNIAYKITERLGGAVALGPLLQGLNGVLHDLSRGCSVDDIMNVALISALQSIGRHKPIN